MSPTLSHVSLLVGAASQAATIYKESGWELGPTEDFPSEGTREIYVGPQNHDGLLLLMEAIGPGPYQNALRKRGPGLHHVAINVSSVDEFLSSKSASGWLLHPQSLHTFTHRKTIYLARPGIKTLIEVKEVGSKGSAVERPRFITEVEVECAPESQRLIDGLGVSGLKRAGQEGAALVIGGKRFSMASLSGS